MSTPLVARLRAKCAGPRDGALLRYALGNALHEAGELDAAIAELRRAVVFDPQYSAAWKALGKVCLAAGQRDEAGAAWRQGIAAARTRGDRQAEKEMQVFLRRIEKAAP